MIKSCTVCGEDKPLEDYYYTHKKNRPNGYYWGECKACTYVRTTKNKKARRNYDWDVYLIPFENYVGISSNVTERISTHKRSGKDVSNWIVINTFDNVYDAIVLEALLHKSGYKGCQYDKN